MSETANALLALADDFLSRRGPERNDANVVWEMAAAMARGKAAEYEDSAAVPGPIPVGPVPGGEHRGVLRAVTEGDG